MLNNPEEIIDPSSIKRINCGQICPKCPKDRIGKWVYAIRNSDGRVVQYHNWCGYYEIREDLEWDSLVKQYINAGAIQWPDKDQLILPSDLPPNELREIYKKRRQKSYKTPIVLFILFIFFIMILLINKITKFFERAPIITTPSAVTSSIRYPDLDQAKQKIPRILDKIYHDLDQGNPRASSSFLASEIIANSRMLDSVCKPFSYRAHYIENIIERPEHKFGARIRVLFQPIEENALLLTFRVENDSFILESVSSYLEDWFGTWKEEAIEVARNFYYALKADKQDVINKLISSPNVLFPEFTSPFRFYPVKSYSGFQSKIRSLGAIRSIYAKIIPYKGLKSFVHFSCESNSIPETWDIYIDNINGDNKIVRWEYKEWTWGARGIDPNLELYTLKRFELSKELNTSQVIVAVPEKEIMKSSYERLEVLNEKEKQGFEDRKIVLEKNEGKKVDEKREVTTYEEREEKKPVRAIGNIKLPKLIKKVEPIYSEIALKAKIEGVVILEVTTDIYGRVKNIKVLRSIPLLDQVAIDAVRQWVYEPVLVDGKPRGVIFAQAVFFKLSSRN